MIWQGTPGRYIRGFLGMTTPLSLLVTLSLLDKENQRQNVNDSHLSPTPLIISSDNHKPVPGS
jgi:hypothetical protein